MDSRENFNKARNNIILSGGRTIIIAFAIFFALGGLGLRYLQKANDENAWRLANEGETSVATIINKRTKTSHTSNKAHTVKSTGVTSYILEYSFPLADSDKKWEGDDDVSEEDYNSVEIGDQFDVRYWTKDPDIATILEDAYADGAQLAKNISTVMMGFAFLMIFILLIPSIRRIFNN
jgi:Protein of unknown function (DUF3592)